MNSQDNFSEQTSGYHESFWTDSAARPVFPSLDHDIDTEVVVVGAGIAGLSVAYCLTKAGRRVVVIDDGEIASGETGRASAHLSNALDDRYDEIEKTFGLEKSKIAAESHTAAIDFVEQVINEEGIDCEFRRVDGYLFLHPSDDLSTLEKEFEAAQRAGLEVELLPAVPGLENHSGPCIRFPRQAQFHPVKYVAGLARAIQHSGGEIYCNSHVDKVSREGVDVGAYRIRAEEVVVATNSPINDIVTMHTKQHPYRTYIVAAEIPRGSLQTSLWWDTGDYNSPWVAKPYHYVRVEAFNDTSDLLIIGGADHKTGQAGKEEIPETERYLHLEAWARLHFPMITNIAYTWSGQVMEPVDMMGFIGLNPGDENIFIVTGDSGNGLTHGTIAGMLIRDLIQGGENSWSDLYDPARITWSLSVAPDFLKEAVNMAGQYKDYLTPGDIESLRELHDDDGAIIRAGTMKVAVYKDSEAQIHAYSAVCPHLGCYVRWNADEKSFDCPCHGSRFSCKGEVVNGPALSDLKPFDMAVLRENDAKREQKLRRDISNRIE